MNTESLRASLSKWLVVPVAIAAAMGGCLAPDDLEVSDEFEQTETPTTKLPLTVEERTGLYHWSEGSEFIPYALIRAVTVNKNDGSLSSGISIDHDRVRFLNKENLARYNLIYGDPKTLERVPVGRKANGAEIWKNMTWGDDQLPIGVTIARAPDTGLISLGVNCAACHVGALDDGGGLRVIDGAPSLFSIQQFFRDALTLIKESKAADPVGFGASVLKEAAAVDLKFGDVPIDTGDPSDKSQLTMKDLKYFQLVTELADKASAGEIDDADAIAEIRALGTMSERRKRLLVARYFFFKGVNVRRTKGEGTPGGFGRTDAFGVARNALFGHLGEFVETTAQVSYPPMFNMETNHAFHYNANGDTVIGRNIGQSIGLGAVVDIYGDDGKGKNATLYGTSNLENLALLEKAIYRIAPPEWQGPPVDPALVERGEEVYRQSCQGCHEPTMENLTSATSGDHFLHVSREFALGSETDGAHIDTDRRQADNFNLPVFAVGPTATIPSLTNPVFKGVFDSYLSAATHKVSGVDSRPWQWSNVYHPQHNPKGRRLSSDDYGVLGSFHTNDTYRAAPLDGFWATAPFLHNGSVPTIADLLKPAKDRPKLFWVGQRGYDTDKLGYDQSVVPASPDDAPPCDAMPSDCKRMSVLDTSLPGNSNRGHEFGVDLSEDDKRALIEFLKGFGARAARPTILCASSVVDDTEAPRATRAGASARDARSLSAPACALGRAELGREVRSEDLLNRGA